MNDKERSDPIGSEAFGAWFLGPLAENRSSLRQLLVDAVERHSQAREDAYPDPKWIDDAVKNDRHYRLAEVYLQDRIEELTTRLSASVPFFSYRYHGHMLWDVTLPAVVGYFTAMLYNQNNVATEASPVTTPLEIWVGNDLCRMLGYDVDGSPRPWGHIACDGSVANIEALWAARNLKAYALAVRDALHEPDLEPAKKMEVTLSDGRQKPLTEADPWEALNLQVDEALSLPARLKSEYGMDESHVETIGKHTLQHLGIAEFVARHPEFKGVAFLCPATSHYSMPKGASLLGVGEEGLLRIPVDLEARMSLSHLRIALDRCVADRRPVAAIVVVMGSTQESAVDPLAEILELRKHYRKKGLDFAVHADAAWGGYFSALIRAPHPSTQAGKFMSELSESGEPLTGAALNVAIYEGRDVRSEADREREVPGEIEPRQALVFTPEITMSRYVEAQYRKLKDADSITVDPHKAGYIPYPAGALCYRNSAMRNMVTFTAPVVYHGGADPTVGVYGIEGSKPGAAAAAIYLSHQIIRPDQSGYGRILGRCLFNCKRFYAALVAMESDTFIVRAIPRLPSERNGGNRPAEIDRIRQVFVEGHVDNKSLWYHLAKNPLDEEFFREIGPDQLIIAYAFNFKDGDRLNPDVKRANDLNKKIFEALSMTKEPKNPSIVNRPDLIVTHSQFDPTKYGKEFVSSFMQRLELRGGPQPVDFLISTIMNPWFTDTSSRAHGGNRIPELIGYLRKTVDRCVTEVKGRSPRP